MTIEEIFAEEVWTNAMLAEVMHCSISTASRKAKEIKRKVGDRLGIRGRLHKNDYLAYSQLFDGGAVVGKKNVVTLQDTIDNLTEQVKLLTEQVASMTNKPIHEMPKKSVCLGGQV